MDSGESGTTSLSGPKSNPREFAAKALRVRPSKPDDHDSILRLLRDLELDYPSRDLTKFVVGEVDGEILAIAELKEFSRFWLLSCVGVSEQHRGRGFGIALLSPLLESLEKDVYLYTLIPGFFRKQGFVEVTTPPISLPPRLIYGCVSCDPNLCLCMVRKRNAPRVP